MRKVVRWSASVIGAGLCLQVTAAERQRVIFRDDFETTDSYHEIFTPNATTQEYKTNSLPRGRLLKKWNYGWDYLPEGDWRQAFYVVAEGETVMTQAGRSACLNGSYRITAKAEIPTDATRYRITFRQFKADNDAICFVLGADREGEGGVMFGYENQLPATDQTVADAYLRGVFGEGVLRPGVAFANVWTDVAIDVDVSQKRATWSMGGRLIAEGVVAALKPGGYFGLYMCYERGTQFDDFEITLLSPNEVSSDSQQN